MPGGITSAISGIAWDGINTLWTKESWPSWYLMKTSGEFSSTVLDSVGISDTAYGITFDNVNTIHSTGNRLIKTSGQFTSTVLDSIYVSSTDVSTNALNFDNLFIEWGS
jgi:hypothetical protein